MITEHNLAQLDELIGKYFAIEQITYGTPKQPFVVRYRGSLRESDSQAAYQHISDALVEHDLLPLIRREDDGIYLYLVPGLEKKKPLNPRLNLILFILTLLSVMFSGGIFGFKGELPQGVLAQIWALLKSGWPFAITLLTILGAHEFGHYFIGRKNGVQVTLPYFIPFPFSLLGTLGAFINMRSLPRNRRALFDLAIAGPLSGFVLSIIALVIGLHLSEINQLPLTSEAGSGTFMEGNSVLYLLLKYLSFGKLLPQPVGVSGLPLFLYWVRYFFTGQPFPWGGTDVIIHPIAWAGWVGLFQTGVNLLPAGQLDGGHIFYTLFGQKTAQRIFPFIIAGMVILGFFSNVWWLWAMMVFFLGRRYAEPLDQITELDSKRKVLGYAALAVFLLTFIPVPITFA